MTAKIRLIFFLSLFAGFSLQAFAFTPKVKKDINDGTGCNNPTVTDGNEVKLPIGLPFSSDVSASASTADDADYSHIVYTFDLPDGQGPETYHETHSAFEQARSLNAACVLIRMSSMSGALDAASNLSNEISDYDRPVMVYVNDKAIPASTLISMAKVKHPAIIETEAKPKLQAPAAKSKCLRTTIIPQHSAGSFSDETSCLNGLGIPCMKNPGTGQNGNLDVVLAEAGLNNYTVVHYSPGFFAQVIDWCMKPFMSLLLVILIALGLRLQVKSVFPGPATFLLMVALPLFIIPLFVGGLAGPAECGLVVFFSVTLLMLARKNSSKSLQAVVAFLLISALSLCECQSPGQLTSWTSLLSTLMITGAAFSAGWFLPLVNAKFRRVPSVNMATA